MYLFTCHHSRWYSRMSSEWIGLGFASGGPQVNDGSTPGMDGRCFNKSSARRSARQEKRQQPLQSYRRHWVLSTRPHHLQNIEQRPIVNQVCDLFIVERSRMVQIDNQFPEMHEGGKGRNVSYERGRHTSMPCMSLGDIPTPETIYAMWPIVTD